MARHADKPRCQPSLQLFLPKRYRMLMPQSALRAIFERIKPESQAGKRFGREFFSARDNFHSSDKSLRFLAKINTINSLRVVAARSSRPARIPPAMPHRLCLHHRFESALSMTREECRGEAQGPGGTAGAVADDRQPRAERLSRGERGDAPARPVARRRALTFGR